MMQCAVYFLHCERGILQLYKCDTLDITNSCVTALITIYNCYFIHDATITDFHCIWYAAVAEADFWHLKFDAINLNV